MHMAQFNQVFQVTQPSSNMDQFVQIDGSQLSDQAQVVHTGSDLQTSVLPAMTQTQLQQQSVDANAGTIITATEHVMTNTSRLNFQQPVPPTNKTYFVHSYRNNNVVNQVGASSNQQNLYYYRTMQDVQTGKTYLQLVPNQPTTIQPRPYYTYSSPTQQSFQVINGSHFRQIPSQPQGNVSNSTQLIEVVSPSNSGPQQGLTWNNCVQPYQNSIILRNNTDPNMYIQTQPQNVMQVQEVPSFVLPQKRMIETYPNAQTFSTPNQAVLSHSTTATPNTFINNQQPRTKVIKISNSPVPFPPQIASTETQIHHSAPFQIQQGTQQNQTLTQAEYQHMNQSAPPTQNPSQTVVHPVEQGTQLQQSSPQTVFSPVQQLVQQPMQQLVQSHVQQLVQQPVQQLSHTPMQQTVQPPLQQPVHAPMHEKLNTANSLPTNPVIESKALKTYSKLDVGKNESITPYPQSKSELNHSNVSSEPVTTSPFNNVSTSASEPDLTATPDSGFNEVQNSSSSMFHTECMPLPVPETLSYPSSSSTPIITETVTSQQIENLISSIDCDIDEPSSGKSNLDYLKVKHQQKAIVNPHLSSHSTDGLSLKDENSDQQSVKTDTFDSAIKRSPVKHLKQLSAETSTSIIEIQKTPKKRGRKPGKKNAVVVTKERKSMRKKSSESSSKKIITISIDDDDANVVAGSSTTSNKAKTPLCSPEKEPEASKPSSFSFENIAYVLFDEVKSLKLSQNSPFLWSIHDVFEFIKDTTGSPVYANNFKAQEIDGSALFLLSLDHIFQLMSSNLGPAVKLFSRISSIKKRFGQT